jgi:hypothetical protein
MALNRKDRGTDRLAREVAALSGETLTDANGKALARAAGASGGAGAARPGSPTG